MRDGENLLTGKELRDIYDLDTSPPKPRDEAPAQRLASLLSATPRPTIEIVVAGERFTARVRAADSLGSSSGPLLEVLLGAIEVSVSASASVAAEPLKCLEMPTPEKSDKETT